jgi:hypothetical protein
VFTLAQLFLIIVFVQIAMPKAVPVVPVPAGPEQMLFDFLLFRGDFSWFYWVAIFGYCFNASRFLKEASPAIKFVHAYVTLVLTGFGGSMATAWVCGMPMSICVNESLPIAMLIAWTVVSFIPGVFDILKSQPVRMVFVMLWEFMRCHVMILCAGQGGQWLMGQTTKNLGYPVPIVAPLLCGVLGGCGGGFQPLNKGLDPIAGGLNWRILSAIIGSVVLQLGLRDPHTKDYLSDDLVKISVILFFVLGPLLGIDKSACAHPGLLSLTRPWSLSAHLSPAPRALPCATRPGRQPGSAHEGRCRVRKQEEQVSYHAWVGVCKQPCVWS